jgi:hypothetical protein
MHFLFGALKKKRHSPLSFGNGNLRIGFIHKVFHSLKQIFAKNNMKNTFEMSRSEFDITLTPLFQIVADRLFRSRSPIAYRPDDEIHQIFMKNFAEGARPCPNLPYQR